MPRHDSVSAASFPSSRVRRAVTPWRLALLLLAASGAGTLAAATESSATDPLPPTEAFVPSATLDGDTLQVDWSIEPGYYLYRDKLALTLEDAGTASLGALEHAAADTVEDDFFGEQAIYRLAATTRAPVRNLSPVTRTATLAVRFQGCADIGLCYPPTTTLLDVELPGSPGAAARQVAAAPASLDAMFGNDADDELLRPDQAYRPDVLETTSGTATLGWQIESGYYLYRDKLTVDLRTADGRVVEALEQRDPSPTRIQQDAFFGETAVWRDSASVVLALGESAPLAGEEATLVVHYQGCADIGVCFPPESVDVPFVATAAASTALAIGSATTGATSGNVSGSATRSGVSSAVDAQTPPASAAASVLGVSEQDRLSAMLGSTSLWWSVLTFFGLGLLLAFTPCVLPMVPILSSLIVGQRDASGDGIGGAHAFRLSAVYVLVMASTYAVLGVLVALSGQNVQVWFQNPWLLSAFAALFVVFALAMFGVFELQLPRALQARLTDASNAQRGRGYRGVIAMGFLSTLIVGPCVTAPLVGALVYIADTGNAWVGGTALFALGLGMGTPLLLIGTSAGSLLPRAGSWMVRVKQGFGLLMLGMAIWMLSRFMDGATIALLTGLLALGAGIWLGAADRLETSSGGWPRLAKGAGLAMSLYGVAVLAGTAAGGASLLRPLAVFGGQVGNQIGGQIGGQVGGVASAAAHVRFERVATVAELDLIVATASAEGRTVMLDFYADWCISCKEMEAFTFTDTTVASLLGDVVTVQVDVTDNDADDKALLDRFGLYAPPAIVFFDTAGAEVREARVVGFMPANRFGEHLDRVLQVTGSRV